MSLAVRRRLWNELLDTCDLCGEPLRLDLTAERPCQSRAVARAGYAHVLCPACGVLAPELGRFFLRVLVRNGR